MLRLTAGGMSSLEIGRTLHLSPATVKTHLQHIYQKLGVSDRAAAVATGSASGSSSSRSNALESTDRWMARVPWPVDSS